ncbi:SGNH/GDSL hydrolase family protein [Mycoplasma sp. 'Moose RK']|uniref:SGNH/GDSL hydrolase family protein n=1 Tax=Mycoplasma sp. 'Moose RK' TaxID=2780095 RepID=UPI0018C257DA|nr:SGNH/GDSL hydrolase family protein [Mycoplasma sp. 'Moose RK']MBG0730848.1 SGNH/GDSL hydrolase family protein [Mycoplasma sp. 'Moose RK']
MKINSTTFSSSSWKKILKLSMFGLVPVITFTTAVSCIVNEGKQNEGKQQVLSKVKYLAIGDSVTSGFNQETYRDFQGKLDSKGVLTGLSYPAFFAHYLQKIKKDALVSYNNLAFSGSTTKNWLHLLDPVKYPGNKVVENPFVQKIDSNEKFNELTSVFGNFDKQTYPDLIKKVKEANFLTMSVGANDIFSFATKIGQFLTPDEQLSKKINDIIAKNEKENPKAGSDSSSGAGFVDPNASLEEKLKKLQEKLLGESKQKDDKQQKIRAELGKILTKDIEEIFNTLKIDLDNLIKELKKLNPNLIINLIGYKLPNSDLVKILRHLLANEFILDVKFLDKTIEKLNSLIRDVSVSNNVNYVDVYDKTLWNDNDQKYNATNFDLHPQIEGHKKIAQELLLKLSINQSDSNKNDDNLKQNIQFDDIVDKKFTYSQAIDLSAIAKSNDELIKKINENIQASDFITEQQKILGNDKFSFKDSFLAVLDQKVIGNLDFKTLIKNSGADFAGQLASNLPKDVSDYTITKALRKIDELSKPYLLDPNTNLLDHLVQKIHEFLKNKLKENKTSEITVNKLISDLISNIISNLNLSKVFEDLVKKSSSSS